jgi:hypothetical protein
MPVQSTPAPPPATEQLQVRDEADSVSNPGFGAAASKLAEPTATPCRLEQRRRLIRDAGGGVVGRVRQGRYPAAGGEVALRVEERFGDDGRLLGATVRAGDRVYTISEQDADAGRLEPLPGVLLAPTAEAAERTPPRCEP